MKIYQFSPLGAAIIFSVLCLGVLGLVVVLPIACIAWTWNAIVPNLSTLPAINMWQAGLLYLACATVFYLIGFIQVDFEAGS